MEDFKMDIKEVHRVIQNKIEDYGKIISELEQNKQDDYVREVLDKYKHYVECLSELNKQLFNLIQFKEHPAFEILKLNYGKCDTEFIFLDDSSYTVKKDDMCTIDDNYILIINEEEFKKKKVFVTEKSINLDNVKMVKILS